MTTLPLLATTARLGARSFVHPGRYLAIHRVHLAFRRACFAFCPVKVRRDILGRDSTIALPVVELDIKRVSLAVGFDDVTHEVPRAPLVTRAHPVANPRIATWCIDQYRTVDAVAVPIARGVATGCA